MHRRGRLSRPAFGKFEEVAEEPSAGHAQAFGVKVSVAEAADHVQAGAGHSERIEQFRVATGLTQRAEAVQDPSVRRAAKADADDDRVAAQAGDTREVGDHDGLGTCRVEETRKRRVVPHL